MTGVTTIEHVTCLGCGCGCDDLTVEVADGRIVNVTPVCPIGRAWFGEGRVPSEVLVRGRPATLEDAVEEVARVLTESVGRCVTYLGPDITSQTQRVTLALADLLRANVDTATSATAAAGLLAGQRRGRATATLGEIRSRADVMVFWGVDPTERYPRYLARYGPKSGEARVGAPADGSLVVSVGIGNGPALAGADLSLTLPPDQEIAALSLMRASVLGQNIPAPSPAIAPAMELAGRLSRASYAVLVYDGEPGTVAANPLRADALIALTQALNTPTRAALSTLRAGGNRVGAEAVLTTQAGYPFAVDYARGYPTYQPGRRGLDQLAKGGDQVLLVLGTPPLEPPSFGRGKKTGRTMIIGPRASQSPLQPHVAIDTGVAGIHESGTGYRMDEVPLELTPPISAPRSAMDVVAAVLDAVTRIVPRSGR
jgi:formylmethanofuran dehydrogenase subunit B